MNYSKLLDQAQAIANKAKLGTLKIDDVTYTLTFIPSEWIYEVKDETGEVVTRFNTKKITVARKWLREWLVN
jgi:hypothetical protein